AFMDLGILPAAVWSRAAGRRTRQGKSAAVRLRSMAAKRIERRRRWLEAQFDVAQDRGDLVAQMHQHALEQLERLALVFVERVALRVRAQIDPLPQVVEREQVVLPGLVEQLEQQALLDIAHRV